MWTLRMYGTSKALIDNRLVYFTEERGCPHGVHAHDDAIGVQEVLNRGSFPKKLGIRCNVVVQIAGSVYQEMFAQPDPSLYGHGALF